jgi:phytol kinase
MSPGAINPWLLAAGLLAALLIFLAVLRAWQRLSRPDPEMVRKVFHLGGGLLALPLPWLFSGPLPVLVLGTASMAVFASLRTVPALRTGPGQVLAAVPRETVGEFCYIVSLMLLFLLARDTPLLYGVPLLVLAVADTFAALVGQEYGKFRYGNRTGGKSVEGSMAFFLAAFLCVHIPVLLFTDTPRLECLLIGVNIGVMVMMAEAAAWWGLDNLIIPLFSYVLLKTFLKLDAAALLEHLGFLTGLALFIHFWRGRTTLASNALFGATLWGYAAWAIADWRWVVPSLIVIILYTSVTSRTPTDHLRIFDFPVVLANLFGGIIWLLLFWHLQDPRIFAAYAAVFGADLSIIALVRHRRFHPRGSVSYSVLWSIGKGLLLLVPSIVLYQGLTLAALASYAGAALAVAVATAVFAIIQPRLEQFPVDTARWLRQSTVTTFASLLAPVPALLPALW